MAPNKYHCSSSQALELTLNVLRIMALIALTSTTTRVSQATVRPTVRLSRSIIELIAKRNRIFCHLQVVTSRSKTFTLYHSLEPDADVVNFPGTSAVNPNAGNSPPGPDIGRPGRSEEHTSELQSRGH